KSTFSVPNLPSRISTSCPAPIPSALRPRPTPCIPSTRPFAVGGKRWKDYPQSRSCVPRCHRACPSSTLENGLSHIGRNTKRELARGPAKECTSRNVCVLRSHPLELAGQ